MNDFDALAAALSITPSTGTLNITMEYSADDQCDADNSQFVQDMTSAIADVLMGFGITGGEVAVSIKERV